eukprot:TRINITY_DN7099_c0_g1_i1.p1 TRINITY_DN7099_c0_g1~~TRINITY_DN7099_c0_g1_i1.p1  ORF type:complete len:127 (-),score=14.50 TRINITY_DN7099_c0_g1_i1:44-424(-)
MPASLSMILQTSIPLEISTVGLRLFISNYQRAGGKVSQSPLWGIKWTKRDMFLRNQLKKWCSEHDSMQYFETSAKTRACLLYTSDAADDTPCVDLGGRRIIKKKNIRKQEDRLNKQKQNASQYTEE